MFFWQFAIVNGRLAELFFEGNKIVGHCYVRAEEYKTRQEKRWVTEDTKKLQLFFRKGRYQDKLQGRNGSF